MEFSDDPAIQFQYMQKFKKETQTNAVHICSEECYSQSQIVGILQNSLTSKWTNKILYRHTVWHSTAQPYEGIKY